MPSARTTRTGLLRGIAALAAALALLLAACGSDGDDSPADMNDPVTEDTGTDPTDEAPDDQPTDDGTDDEAPDDSGGQGSETDDRDIVANPPEKTWQDALDAALAEFDGGVTKIELELEDGSRLEYKIELMSTTEKFAIEFDGDTLEELSRKTDDLGDDAEKKQDHVFDPAEVIELDEAADIARGEVDGWIEEWKIEGKDGGLVKYEFDVVPHGETDDVEVEIDAMTGEVLEVDD